MCAASGRLFVSSGYPFFDLCADDDDDDDDDLVNGKTTTPGTMHELYIIPSYVTLCSIQT